MNCTIISACPGIIKKRAEVLKMKRIICIVLAALMLLALTACGGNGKWTREGSFTDDDGNLLTITYLEDSEEKGWYVGCMFGEKSYGWTLFPKGGKLQGDLNPEDKDNPFVVTISEEGEKDVKMEVEGGKTYIFKYYEMADTAKFSVRINTEGNGEFAYAEEGEELVFDEEYPSQTAQLNLAEAATYTMKAKANDGFKFVKWTKNGEDFSTDEQITVEFTEDVEYIAVFE